MARRATRHLLLCAPLVAGCSETPVSSTQGLGEPIVVVSGQFLPGTLPGLPPLDGAAPTDAGLELDAAPHVVDINVANALIAQGEQGLVMSGHASTNAQTVGLRFADLGTGYWVVPLGAPDPSDNNLLTWQLTADFARNLPPGFHSLLFTSVNANGASGDESSLTVCIDTPVPDNLNICNPSRPPPAAVLSLSWDTPVDLELTVETPSGTLLGGTGAAPSIDGGTATTSTTRSDAATVDHESNRNCVIDNIDREDVVWQSTPETGTYQVWVDLVRACQQPAVSFSLSLWLAETLPDGTKRLVEQTPPVVNGELLASQANGGTTSGLFVGSFMLQ
jgi:hypothetical protein